MKAVFAAQGLSVSYDVPGGSVRALRDVSLSLEPGGALGLAGESGSGKSTLALAALRLFPENARVTAGRILFEGRDLMTAGDSELRAVRGGPVGMVFQDPFSALNPVLTVGDQVEEVLETHAGGRSRERVLGLLAEVQLPEPERIYGSYPHQLSGGQRQRAALAMALAGGPKLLVADEPTTALDVTAQRGVLDLLDDLRRRHGMALLLITHNLGLLAERTERLAILYAGEIVEEGRTADLLSGPMHPYTQGLLASLPRLGRRLERLPALPGYPPDLRRLPAGCPFRPRCPKAFGECERRDPSLKERAGRWVACHLYDAS